MEKFKKDFFIYIGLWVLFGIISAIWIRTPYFDWLNYHYYNGFAFAEHRYHTDFMAANMRSYFIPYIEVCQYFLLNLLNNHPRIFNFIEAWDTAAIFFLCYKIGDFIFSINKKFKYTVFIWSFLYLIFAPLIILLSEFSMVDLKIAIPVLLTFYLLIKYLFIEDKYRIKGILSAGIILGIAIALKLTVSVYYITFILCILFLYKKINNPLKVIITFSLGSFISFALLAGSWYLFIYHCYDNPFFPYFNSIFKSDYNNYSTLLNNDYGHLKPKNIEEFLFYPFIYAPTRYFGFDEKSFDLRFATAIVSTIFILISLTDKIKEKFLTNIININHLCFLCLFILISYYTNVAIFGTYRYITTSFVLMSFVTLIALYLICKNILFKEFLCYSLLLLITLTFTFKKGTFVYPEFIGNNTKIISVKDMKVEDGSYVLIFGNKVSFVIPFQNHKAHYVLGVLPNVLLNSKINIRCVDLKFQSYHFDSHYLNNKLSKILESNKQVYIITPAQYKEIMHLYQKAINFYSGNTRKIESCHDMQVKIYGKKERDVIFCKLRITDGH